MPIRRSMSTSAVSLLRWSSGRWIPAFSKSCFRVYPTLRASGVYPSTHLLSRTPPAANPLTALLCLSRARTRWLYSCSLMFNLCTYPARTHHSYPRPALHMPEIMPQGELGTERLLLRKASRQRRAEGVTSQLDASLLCSRLPVLAGVHIAAKLCSVVGLANLHAQ